MQPVLYSVASSGYPLIDLDLTVITAANMSAEADARLADYEQALAAARTRADHEQRSIRSEAATHQREVTDKARKESDEALEQARATVRTETEQARKDLATRADELAADIASKLLGREVA